MTGKEQSDVNLTLLICSIIKDAQRGRVRLHKSYRHIAQALANHGLISITDIIWLEG